MLKIARFLLFLRYFWHFFALSVGFKSRHLNHINPFLSRNARKRAFLLRLRGEFLHKSRCFVQICYKITFFENFFKKVLTIAIMCSTIYLIG